MEPKSVAYICITYMRALALALALALATLNITIHTHHEVYILHLTTRDVNKLHCGMLTCNCSPSSPQMNHGIQEPPMHLFHHPFMAVIQSDYVPLHLESTIPPLPVYIPLFPDLLIEVIHDIVVMAEYLKDEKQA